MFKTEKGNGNCTRMSMIVSKTMENIKGWGHEFPAGVECGEMVQFTFFAISPPFFDIFTNGWKLEERKAWFLAGADFLADPVNRQTKKQHLLKSCFLKSTRNDSEPNLVGWPGNCPDAYSFYWKIISDHIWLFRNG